MVQLEELKLNLTSLKPQIDSLKEALNIEERAQSI